LGFLIPKRKLLSG